MLVITRKTSESIMIGDNIEIIISEIGTDKVKIAVNAPKEIPVFRKELLEIKEQNEQASAVTQKQAVDLLKNLLK